MSAPKSDLQEPETKKEAIWPLPSDLKHNIAEKNIYMYIYELNLQVGLCLSKKWII